MFLHKNNLKKIISILTVHWRIQGVTWGPDPAKKSVGAPKYLPQLDKITFFTNFVTPERQNLSIH